MHNWLRKFPKKQTPYLASECSTFCPHAVLLSHPWSYAESQYHPSKSRAGTCAACACGWRLRDSNAALQLWRWGHMKRGHVFWNSRHTNIVWSVYGVSRQSRPKYSPCRGSMLNVVDVCPDSLPRLLLVSPLSITIFTSHQNSRQYYSNVLPCCCLGFAAS